MADLIESVAVVTVRLAPADDDPLRPVGHDAPRVRALPHPHGGGPRGVRIRVHPRRADRRARPPQHRPAPDRPAVRRPGGPHWQAAWSNNAILASGIGLRALWLVDLATWDLAARARAAVDLRLPRRRAPADARDRDHRLPAEPHRAEVAAQVEAYLEAGWRRFKQPIAGTPEATRARLARPARRWARTAGSGMDCNWVFKYAQDAIDFAALDRGCRARLDGGHRPARQRADGRRDPQERAVPVAMGDEQGGSYHPSRCSPTTRSMSSAST